MTQVEKWKITSLLLVFFTLVFGTALITDNPDRVDKHEVQGNKSEAVCNISNRYIYVDNYSETYYSNSRNQCWKPGQVNNSSN